MLQGPMKFIGIPQLDQQLTVLFPDSPIMINSPGTVLESLDSVQDLLSAVFLGPFFGLI